MKKVLTIVALSLVGLIVITTIVLGFINVSFEQVTINEAYSLTVYKNGDDQTYLKTDTDTTVFNDLNNLFNKQSEQSILKSLFTGAFSVEAEVINEATTLSQNQKLNNGYWLVYKFDQEQTLKIDGEEYKDITQKEQTVTYKKLAVSVVKTEDMELVTMYIFSTTASTTATHTIRVYANLASTYEYISNLEI